MWIFYIIGALLVLVWKLQRHVYFCKGKGMGIKQAIADWFEVSTLSSQSSWVVTVGVVWVIGAGYINHLDIDALTNGFHFLPTLPRHDSVAFLLGALMELIAPPIVKSVILKISNGDKLL